MTTGIVEMTGAVLERIQKPPFLAQCRVLVTSAMGDDRFLVHVWSPLITPGRLMHEMAIDEETQTLSFKKESDV